MAVAFLHSASLIASLFVAVKAAGNPCTTAAPAAPKPVSCAAYDCNSPCVTMGAAAGTMLIAKPDKTMCPLSGCTNALCCYSTTVTSTTATTTTSTTTTTLPTCGSFECGGICDAFPMLKKKNANTIKCAKAGGCTKADCCYTTTTTTTTVTTTTSTTTTTTVTTTMPTCYKFECGGICDAFPMILKKSPEKIKCTKAGGCTKQECCYTTTTTTTTITTTTTTTTTSTTTTTTVTTTTVTTTTTLPSCAVFECGGICDAFPMLKRAGGKNIKCPKAGGCTKQECCYTTTTTTTTVTTTTSTTSTTTVTTTLPTCYKFACNGICDAFPMLSKKNPETIKCSKAGGCTKQECCYTTTTTTTTPPTTTTTTVTTTTTTTTTTLPTCAIFECGGICDAFPMLKKKNGKTIECKSAGGCTKQDCCYTTTTTTTTVTTTTSTTTTTTVTTTLPTCYKFACDSGICDAFPMILNKNPETLKCNKAGGCTKQECCHTTTSTTTTSTTTTSTTTTTTVTTTTTTTTTTMPTCGAFECGGICDAFPMLKKKNGNAIKCTKVGGCTKQDCCYTTTTTTTTVTTTTSTTSTTTVTTTLPTCGGFECGGICDAFPEILKAAAATITCKGQKCTKTECCYTTTTTTTTVTYTTVKPPPAPANPCTTKAPAARLYEAKDAAFVQKAAAAAPVQKQSWALPVLGLFAMFAMLAFGATAVNRQRRRHTRQVSLVEPAASDSAPLLLPEALE